MSGVSTSGSRETFSGKRVDRSLVVGWSIMALLMLTPFLTEFAGGNYVQNIVLKAMILAIAAVSLDLLIGHGGLVSFGHAAFLGLGSYVTGVALHEGVVGAVPIIAMVVIFCGLFAMITGAISLRTSGVYFIMITLAFGQMLFFSLSSLSSYGGDDGLTLWDTPILFGQDDLLRGTGLFYVTLILLVACWLLVWRLSLSRFGRVLRAAKENPQRVSTLGFNIFHIRLIAYVIAGTLAGVAGFLTACQTEFISPSTAAWQNSGNLIIMVVLGGLGTRNGAVLGALFVVFAEEGLSLITHDWRLIFGPVLVLFVLFAKGGIANLLPNSTAGQ